MSAARLTGKYRGSGFMVTYKTAIKRPVNELLCFERVSTGGVAFNFNQSLGPGAYCNKIIHGVFAQGSDMTYNRIYFLP